MKVMSGLYGQIMAGKIPDRHYVHMKISRELGNMYMTPRCHGVSVFSSR